MRTRCLIAAIALCVSGAIAAAEPVRFSDLEGTTLEASWTEALTFRPENEKSPRGTYSPRQITVQFGPNGAIKHQLIRQAAAKSRTDNRDMQIDKAQPSGIGMVRWAFEDGKLVYIETLFSGARRLIVSLDKKGDAITCTIAAMVAREGNKPVLTIALDSAAKIELLDVKATGDACKITKR